MTSEGMDKKNKNKLTSWQKWKSGWSIFGRIWLFIILCQFLCVPWIIGAEILQVFNKDLGSYYSFAKLILSIFLITIYMPIMLYYASQISGEFGYKKSNKERRAEKLEERKRKALEAMMEDEELAEELLFKERQ
jgi:hypothetical protein